RSFEGLGVMDLCVTIKGVSFLLQTGMGILGNTVVLLAYGHIIYTEPKLLPVDMILCHLAFANLTLLLTRCVPQTMTVFGLKDLLNDPGCKVRRIFGGVTWFSLICIFIKIINTQVSVPAVVCGHLTSHNVLSIK
uniref:Vomeronasal type-1 receptor n=1 Tax=Lates calcarifer TaxID=8187 RepID=A0A4W6CU49_LATCA